MEFTAKDVAKLRELTGAGFADCKNALTSAKTLRGGRQGSSRRRARRAPRRSRRQDRETREGLVASYIHHGGNLGVLLELNCSTDFVARSEEFKTLARELALQIAGTNPKYVAFSDVPEDEMTRHARATGAGPRGPEAPGEAARADRRGQAQEAVLRACAAGAALGEGRQDHRRQAGGRCDPQDRRERRRAALRALRARRGLEPETDGTQWGSTA